MNLKKSGLILFVGLFISSFSYGQDYVKDYPPGVTQALPSKVDREFLDEDDDNYNEDFIRIRRERYENGKNVRKILYFSRWHDYLEEVAEEKMRQQEYENSMRRYESELNRVNKENQRIRESSQSSSSEINASQGNSINIEDLNYQGSGN